jgi:hypothetical protein
MNHNDINRQCAEVMGICFHEMYIGTGGYPTAICRKCGENITPQDFRNDWNAMKLLVEYANERDFALCLSEEGKGICVAEFISRKVNGGYFCDDADTFAEAVALAFLKCFVEDE